jgi:hypothetical protein
MTKYTLTFVSGCCPLQSLGNASSISATAGTDFLESYVEQSATVPDFQGLPGNNAFIAVFSFSETIRHHTGLNQASKGAEGPQS